MLSGEILNRTSGVKHAGTIWPLHLIASQSQVVTSWLLAPCPFLTAGLDGQALRKLGEAVAAGGVEFVLG